MPNTGDALISAFGAQIIAGLLAAIGYLWKERSRRRDLEARHSLLLSQIRNEIEVIQAWVEASKLIAPREAQAEIPLERDVT